MARQAVAPGHFRWPLLPRTDGGTAGTHHNGDGDVDLLVLVGQREADPRIHEGQHKVDACRRRRVGGRARQGWRDGQGVGC